MVRPRLAVLGLLLATAASAHPAEPNPAAVRAYERGARELEFARYDEAATAFEAAIALDPVESRQPVARPSGMNFEPYLPHLALGLVRCEVGNFPGAAASWVESDRQAVARGARGASRLLTRREECSGRHRESLNAAWRVLTLPAARADAEASEPPAASANPPRYEGATASLTRVAGEVDAPEPPAAAAESASSAASPPSAAGDVAESPPVELLRAAQELFDGRPERTYEMLARFASERSRTRGQAHLLRAAACFDLARLEPGSAAVWLARAGEERSAARRVTPTLLPDRRFFAPAFIEFFADGADPAPLPDLLAR